MKPLFFYETSAGVFFICRSEDGLFHPVFDNESYGAYSTPSQAAEDLALDVVGSILHPLTGELLDPSELGVPEDISEWERC